MLLLVGEMETGTPMLVHIACAGPSSTEKTCERRNYYKFDVNIDYKYIN